MVYAHKRQSLSMIVTEAVMRQGEATWELRQPSPHRHQREPKWVSHRFPVKGGKTSQEMMWSMVSEKNALLQHLLKRNLTETNTSATM
jgi:hypothetical protein